MFDEILALRKLLPKNQKIKVNHSGHIWIASFEWNALADDKSIHQLESELDVVLPNDLKLFLTRISNGAVLFYDAKYGQWGVEIYSVKNLITKQNDWKKSLPSSWNSNLIAFGELFGESNVLVLDMTRPTSDAGSFAILEGDAYSLQDMWPVLSRSFHEWLDHLVTAQGDKYWLWK